MSIIDLSNDPYFDDFNRAPTEQEFPDLPEYLSPKEKGYYRVLFRPGFAVQTRELNQIQSILQNQVDQFGRHIFRDGSIVLGGSFDVETDLKHVKTVVPDGANLDDFSALIGQNIVGTQSDLRAFVIDGELDPDTGNFVYIVRYRSSNEGDERVFRNNEELQDETGVIGLAPVTVSEDATGNASLFSIDEGVLFTNGIFASFPRQKIILDRYSSTPTTIVGFDISGAIVTAAQDMTLLDNAAGSFNHKAPGADRLALSARLVKRDIDAPELDTEVFSELVVIRNGVIEDSSERTQYSRIYEEVARRTFDQSGDFYVRGLGVRTRERLDTGVNEGLLDLDELTQDELNSLGQELDVSPTIPAISAAISQQLSLDVEPGLAYVKGYEVNNLVTRHIITPKSVDTDISENQTVIARTGGFIRINQALGSIPVGDDTIVDFYDQAEERISGGVPITSSMSGNKIGSARVKSAFRQSGTIGQPDGTFTAHLYDIRMDGAPIGEARAIRAQDGSLVADVIVDQRGRVYTEEAENRSVFDIGTSDIKEISGVSYESSETNTSLSIDFNTGGTTVLTIAGKRFPFGISALDLSPDQRQRFVLTINSNVDIDLDETVTAAEGQKTVTRVGTNFDFTNLNVGERIRIGTSEEYIIESIVSSSELTVTENITIGGGHTEDDLFRVYKNGDMVNMTGIGTNGQPRMISVLGGSDGKSISINLNDVGSTAVIASASLLYPFQTENALHLQKSLATSWIEIDGPALDGAGVPLGNAPLSLGTSDVFELLEVRVSNAAFTGLDDGSDVTSSFSLDNGQRDNLYEHGQIIPRGFSVSPTDYLLVKIRHFVPSAPSAGRIGYFTVNSYPVPANDVITNPATQMNTWEIPVYEADFGDRVDLRDSIDFRPVRETFSSSTKTVDGATVRVIGSVDTGTGFALANSVMPVIPRANSGITMTIEYYLARRDIVVVDRDGNFDVVNGTPGVVPVSPTISENVMGIANIFVTPYPSLSGTFARIVGRREIGCQANRIAHVRHTMREIGVLKNRIESLENITALNLLEKNAQDLKILDEDGLDRFKNGFFVDNFASHVLGDTSNLDYRVAIDKNNRELRPFFEMDSFRYQFDQGGPNIKVTGKLITVDYEETPLIEQLRVSTTRNIEQSVFRYPGELVLDPRHDMWMDETTVDKTVDVSEDIGSVLEAAGVPLTNTVWDSWRTYSSGSSTFDRVVQQLAPGQRAIIDTLRRTTEQQERLGVETTIAFEQQLQELGNFVTDVSIVPYIRPQTIQVYASGLLPNTRMFLFFDGENMSDFVSPFDPESSDPLELSPILADFGDDTELLPEGTPIRTDKFGVFYGELRLPVDGKRFRVGTKKVVLSDSPTNAIDAVASAEEYFVAQGLEVQKQNTILSTQVPVIEQRELRQTRTKTYTNRISRRVTCMAYSFLVDVPEGEEGVFLTSVDVFIQSLDPELGVWFEIMEMDAGGGITRSQVPFSEVWMNRDDSRLQISEDGITNPTNVNFESPVFLQNDTQYAFVIHTIGINPNTRFWVARLGEEDLRTGDTITSRRLTGTVFTTNNGLNWDIVPDLDLTVRFNRASFDTSSSFSVATLVNRPYDFLNTTITEDSPDSTFRLIGEQVITSEALTLSGASVTILVEDVLVGQNGGGEVLSIPTEDSIVKHVTDGNGFEQGEIVDIFRGGTLVGTATVTSVEFARGRLEKYNAETGVMRVLNRNGEIFRTGRIVRGATSEVSASIDSIGSFPYELNTVKPNYLRFNRTDIRFDVDTVNADNPSANPGNRIGVEPHENTIYPTEKVLASYSSNPVSNVLTASMRTATEFVSPVIDLDRAHSIYVHNRVNTDVTGEDGIGFPFGGVGTGSLINRYISQIVTLAEGQDGQDLNVVISAYLPPPDANIRIWIKALNVEDGESIERKPWIELDRVSEETVVSSISNPNDFREVRYHIPRSMIIERNDEDSFEYEVDTGETDPIVFRGFRQFQVKVGLLSSNAARVPRVKDLRAIALQT